MTTIWVTGHRVAKQLTLFCEKTFNVDPSVRKVDAESRSMPSFHG